MTQNTLIQLLLRLFVEPFNRREVVRRVAYLVATFVAAGITATLGVLEGGWPGWRTLLSVFVAAVIAAGAEWARTLVTPVADPYDDNGNRLVPDSIQG